MIQPLTQHSSVNVSAERPVTGYSKDGVHLQLTDHPDLARAYPQFTAQDLASRIAPTQEWLALHPLNTWFGMSFAYRHDESYQKRAVEHFVDLLERIYRVHLPYIFAHDEGPMPCAGTDFDPRRPNLGRQWHLHGLMLAPSEFCDVLAVAAFRSLFGYAIFQPVFDIAGASGYVASKPYGLESSALPPRYLRRRAECGDWSSHDEAVHAFYAPPGRLHVNPTTIARVRPGWADAENHIRRKMVPTCPKCSFAVNQPAAVDSSTGVERASFVCPERARTCRREVLKNHHCADAVYEKLRRLRPPVRHHPSLGAIHKYSGPQTAHSVPAHALVN